MWEAKGKEMKSTVVIRNKKWKRNAIGFSTLSLFQSKPIFKFSHSVFVGWEILLCVSLSRVYCSSNHLSLSMFFTEEAKWRKATHQTLKTRTSGCVLFLQIMFKNHCTNTTNKNGKNRGNKKTKKGKKERNY